MVLYLFIGVFFTVDHPEYPDGPGAGWLQLLQDRQA